MSFAIRLVSTRNFEFAKAVLTLGNHKETTTELGELMAFPPVEDGDLKVQVFSGDAEVGTVKVDLHTVQADTSEWFTLPNNAGAVQLHFDVLDEAEGTGSASEDGDVAVDPFANPAAAPNAGGFDFLAHDGGDAGHQSEEEEEEEEEEEHEEDANSPLKLWQEQHTQDIMNRAVAARAKRDERKMAAREWLKKFYEDRDKQLSAKASLNRQQNAALIDRIDANLGRGSIWERVTNLINMNATAASRKDVNRMRTVLLHIKNETPEHLRKHDAAGAGGAKKSAASSSGDFF